jgi:hypothetical protein
MAADRRLVWVGASLVVAVVAVMMARSGSDTPAAAPRRPASAPQAAAPAAGTAPPEVNLPALQAAREAPATAGRDPFRFRPRPVPAAPPAQRLRGIPDDQVGAPPPSVPAGPPPPPPITLKFIGLVQKADGTKIAVLSDGKRPIHGQEGEEIEGRYVILKIGTESLDIAYIDGRGRQTLRLTGQ